MEHNSFSETEYFIQLALEYEQTGDISGALRLARQALNAARASGLPLASAQALTAVARYRFRLGQYKIARDLATEALEMTDTLQDAQAAVHVEALLILGMCALETSSLAECEQHYRSAANLAREIGHPVLFQRALHNLGSGVYLFRGQFDLAINADSQSLQICRENNLPNWAMFPLITLAIAYQITGQRIRAHETLAELRASAQAGSAGEGYACYVSGMLALDEDDLQKADVELSRAIKLAEELGDPSLNLDTRLGISRMYKMRGETSKAFGWAEDALNYAQRVGYRIYQGRTQLEFGRTKWLSGDLPGAEKEILQAETIFIDMDLRCDLAEARLLLAALYQQKQDPRGSNYLQQATAAIRSGGYGFILERERSLVYSLASFIDDPNPEYSGAADELVAILQVVPPKPLNVVTFGNFEVWVGAKKVDGRILRQRHAGELFALLLSSPGHALLADKVTEALCPEKDPQAASDFYHHAVSALRRILEPDLPDRRLPCRYLEVSEERIRLILPPGSKIDYNDFEQHLAKKEWQAAMENYRGEYLPMYCYSEWTIAPRQHFADLFERALLTRAAELLAIGDAPGCLELAQRALLQNSWQEQAVELGMRAGLLMGDRSGAIKLYKRLEKILERDLGIAPQAQLQQLYQEIVKRPPNT